MALSWASRDARAVFFLLPFLPSCSSAEPTGLDDAAYFDSSDRADGSVADVVVQDVAAQTDALRDTAVGAWDGADGKPLDAAGGATNLNAHEAWINAQATVEAATNSFGIRGRWRIISDGDSTVQQGNPYDEKLDAYCVSGTTFANDPSKWGAGLALDLNIVQNLRQPYDWRNRIKGFRLKLYGAASQGRRVQFVTADPLPANLMSPFISVATDSADYLIVDAKVPVAWTDVANAGATVGSNGLYTLAVQVVGGSIAGPFRLCIKDFLPLSP